MTQLNEIKIKYKDREVALMVRPETQDQPMAQGEVFGRDYYRQYGKLEIKPGDIVVDLGANIGSFSILAGIEGASKIIAVEPHPESLEILKMNLENNRQYFENPVTVFEGAVMGTSDNKVPLYLNNDSKATGSHTLTPLTSKDRSVFKSINVKSFTLDEIIEKTGIDRIDFLKVDIEGAEYETIDYCSKLDIVRQMSFEWHYGVPNFCHLVTKLINSGFTVAWFEGDSKRGKLQVYRG